MVSSKAKCWGFIKVGGKWFDEEEVIMKHGLFGASESSEDYAHICLDVNGIEDMTWPDAWGLLKKLIKVRDDYLGR